MYLYENVAERACWLIKEQVANLSVGSPEQDSTIVPLIDDKSADFVQGLVDDAVEKVLQSLSVTNVSVT